MLNGTCISECRIETMQLTFYKLKTWRHVGDKKWNLMSTSQKTLVMTPRKHRLWPPKMKSEYNRLQQTTDIVLLERHFNPSPIKYIGRCNSAYRSILLPNAYNALNIAYKKLPFESIPQFLGHITKSVPLNYVLKVLIPQFWRENIMSLMSEYYKCTLKIHLSKRQRMWYINCAKLCVIKYILHLTAEQYLILALVTIMFRLHGKCLLLDSLIKLHTDE